MVINGSGIPATNHIRLSGVSNLESKGLTHGSVYYWRFLGGSQALWVEIRGLWTIYSNPVALYLFWRERYASLLL